MRSKNSATSLEMRVVAAAMLVFDEAKAEADVYEWMKKERREAKFSKAF